MSSSRNESQSKETTQNQSWMKIILVNAITPIAVTAWTFPFRYFQSNLQILDELKNPKITGLVKWRLLTINFLNSLRAAFTKSAIIANAKPMQSSMEQAFNHREPKAEIEKFSHEELQARGANNKFRATMFTSMILAIPDSLNPFINLSILNTAKKDPKLNWGQIWQVNKVGFSFRYVLSASNAVALLSLPIMQEQINSLFPHEYYNKQNYLLAAGTNSLLFSFLRAPLSTLHKNLVAGIQFTENDVTRKVNKIEIPSLLDIAKKFKGKEMKKLWRGSLNYFPMILPTMLIVDNVPDLVEGMLKEGEKYFQGNQFAFFKPRNDAKVEEVPANKNTHQMQR